MADDVSALNDALVSYAGGMNDTSSGGGALASALSQPPETTNAPVGGVSDLQAPAESVPASQPLENLQPAAQPDLPRFQRTFGNTLKGMLVGFGLAGIPGAVAGGINPRGAQRAVQQNAEIQQAKITFANAQAAHEVAMAHQADAEYQALPEKLQQEAEGRGLDNISKAHTAGFMPIAQIQLDQGTEQNSVNAMTALNQVKQQFGAVPQGLLYIHTGDGVTVMKLQNANAALPAINQVRRAQGLSELDQSMFGSLAQADRDSMARDAINFTFPTDVNGMVTQNSLNVAQMRLATVKAQPGFNGKDTLVTQLQDTVDHQKAVLDSGALAEANRKGQATGAEAQAAQPGQTAAKVADISATAGPLAKAAGQKAGAEAAAQFPFQARLEQMKQGGSPVYAYDPAQKATVLTTKADAQAKGMQAVRNVTQPEIEKDTTRAMQLGDAQMNVSAYRVASQAMDELSGTDIRNVARLIGSQEFKAQFLGAELPMDWANKLATNDAWEELPPDAKDAVAGYIGARGAIIAYTKAISGSGRLTEQQLETETKNLPDPTVPSDVREKMFDRFQRNIDQAASNIPKIPGVEHPSDIRARVEGQAVKAYSAAQAAKGAARQQTKPSSYVPARDYIE